MMPDLRVQLCSAPKQLRTGEPLIKKQTNLIQRRKTYVNHGICICAGRNRHGSGQPANGRNHGGEARERCSGHGNTHSEPNGPAGAAGFPCGNDHIPIGQRTKIMLLSKVKVGISACGIGILDGKNVSDYIRTFEINELTSADDVTSVAEKLHKYAFKYFPQVNFFVCGYQNDEPFVYIVNKEIKRSNIENGRMRYASIWSGEQAAITKLLNGNPPMMINHVLMPLKDAIDFADFLVDATIKSQRFEMKPATCGGDIDILVLTKDDSFWFRHKVYKPGR